MNTACCLPFMTKTNQHSSMYSTDIEDLPNPVKKQLFEELLDANAQKGNVSIPV
jgi:hypothetical protein